MGQPPLVDTESLAEERRLFAWRLLLEVGSPLLPRARDDLLHRFGKAVLACGGDGCVYGNGMTNQANAKRHAFFDHRSSHEQERRAFLRLSQVVASEVRPGIRNAPNEPSDGRFDSSVI